jgi:lipoprotein signal peptidase
VLVAFGIVLVAFTALGAVIDRFLVIRHRSALHTAMVRWWTMIHDTSVPELPTLAAQRVLKLGKFIFPWKLLSWQAAGASIIISWSLTTAAFLLGNIIDGEPWRILPSQLPLATVYLANFPYDLLTILATVRVLQLLRTSPNVGISFGIIALNIIVVAFLAVFCFSSIYWASDFAVKYDLPAAAQAAHKEDENRRQQIEAALGPEYKYLEDKTPRLHGFWRGVAVAPRRMWEQLRYGNSSAMNFAVVTARPVANGKTGEPQVKLLKLPVRYGWGPVLLALSTFLPVAGYMAILLVLLVAKLVLKAVRGIVLYTLETLTEHDPIREPKDFMPFTILGTTLGTIVSTVRTIVTLIEKHHY